MKLKYNIGILALLLSLGSACDDGTLDHEDINIPDRPADGDENFEDDGVAEEPTTNAVLEIKFAEENRHQVIDGFGCAFAEWSHRIYTNTQREEVLRELFDPKTGLGLNIFRGEPFPHYEDPATGEIDFGMKRTYKLSASDPSLVDGFWDYYNGVEAGKAVQLGQMWLFDIVSSRYKDVSFILSTWSPAPSMKTNGSAKGGSLKEGQEKKYANYLVQFIKEYEKKFGIKIYAISPANEPNTDTNPWSCCLWQPENLAKFCVENLRPALDNAGLQETKIIFGEHSWWRNGADYVKEGFEAYPELADPERTIAAGHGYSLGSGTKYLQYDAAVEKGVHVWNTETSSTDTYNGSWDNAMFWAESFHKYLSEANLNSFIWWAGARPCVNNESLIVLQEKVPGETYTKPDRFYSYGQFTKFIPRGSYRVDVESVYEDGTENPLPDNLLRSAYVTDDTYTMVLVNKSDEKIDTRISLSDKDFQNMRMYTSDENVKWKYTKINPAPSGARWISIPAKSVVTVTGNIKK